MNVCIEFYNEFIEAVNTVTPHNASQYNDDIENRVTRFYNSLEDQGLFDVFAGSKIKVFSATTVETHNISTSLFGDKLPIKYLFNNMEDKIKDHLWIALYNLYVHLERHFNKRQDRIDTIKQSIRNVRGRQKTNIKSDLFKDVIKADVNDTTSNMLDDIISSFQDITSGANANPFENIMGITEKIAQKYGQKIESGEVEVDKIINGMGGMFKGMGGEKEPETVVMDENFSTAAIDVGNLDEEKKGGFDLNQLAKLAPLTEMLNKVGSINSEDDAVAFKNTMDQFMEKELKVDMSQYKETIENLEKQLGTKL